MSIRQLFFLVASAAVVSAFPTVGQAQVLSDATVITADGEFNTPIGW